MPHRTRAVVPRGGHLPRGEETDVCNRQLVEFLRDRGAEPERAGAAPGHAAQRNGAG